MADKLTIIPIPLREANQFILSFHRHSKPVTGARFCIGASFQDKLVGVAIVGRPVARRLDDGFTAEITRVCTNLDAPKNTNSFLYGRCWRIWQQMGGTKIVTYTLQTESGSSLKGAGYMQVKGGWTSGKGWDTRPGRNWQPTTGQLKFKWEKEVC